MQQARALRDAAAAALWPLLSGSLAVQRGRSDGVSTGNNFQAGVDGSWDTDLFGANRSGLRASNASLEASAASLGDVQVTVAAEVGLNYILLRNAQARLAIAADNLASQRETLQITAWREQAGLTAGLNTEQARAAAEQTAALLPALHTSIAQTRHALAVLTGQPPAALDALLGPAAGLPQADTTLTLSIPAETLRQRADVRAAELQVAFALARVSQAEAARWPGFSLAGSLGSSAASVDALTGNAAVVSSLLARLSLTLFDGGAARAQVRAQRAALDQARAAYQAAVLGALKDVEDALVAFSDDQHRLVNLRNAAAAASHAATLARQQFSSGLVDFQTVLDTQRTQLATQDGLALANADVSSDQVLLFKALGGGWRDSAAGAGASP